MAYPRFIRARTHKSVMRTSGNISVTSNSVFVAFDTNLDIALEAQAGDTIEVGLSAMCDNTASPLDFDAAFIVGGSVTNWVSGGATTGVPAWNIRGSDYLHAGGSILKALLVGDVSGGQVTVRLFTAIEGTVARSVLATINTPVHFFAKNLGPADPT